MTHAFTRRRLGLFWAALVLGLGIGAGTLQWMGPPSESMAAEAPAMPETPAEVAVAAPAPPPQVQTQAQAEIAPVANRPPAASPPAAPPPSVPAAGSAAQAAGGTGTGGLGPAAAAPVAAAPVAAAPVAAAPVAAAPAVAAAGASPTPAAPTPPPLGAQPVAARAAVPDPVIPPPDPQLLERSRNGMVPKLGPEGRTSIRAYARPFDRDADRRPRIGLVIGNVGLFAQHSDEAIARLPGAVTLAFSPYALRPQPLLERARARGMEVLVALPLEPAGFGQDADPGDRALLTGLPVEENLERLDWALSRIQGQVGAIGALGRLRGERFAANADLLGTIQAALTTRGLLYVDPRPGAPTPARACGRTVDLVLDDPSETRSEVERRLLELEALARRNGSALGLLGNPAPFFTAAILAWSAGLDERGVVLVPVTVLLRRPGEQASQAAPAGSQTTR